MTLRQLFTVGFMLTAGFMAFSERATAGILEETYSEEFDRKRISSITEALGLSNREAFSAARMAMSYVWVVACKAKVDDADRGFDAIRTGAWAKEGATKMQIAVLAIIGAMVMDTVEVKIKPEACEFAKRMGQ